MRHLRILNSQKLVVSDSDVLIHLAKLNILTSTSKIFKILIPNQIKNELLDTKKAFINQNLILSEIRNQNIEIVNVEEQEVEQLIEKNSIHYGEASVIALALNRKINIILLNERKVRNVAKQVGITPVGTIGILLTLTKKGEISKEKTIQLLLLMKKNPKDYWIDPEIIDRIIKDLKF
jgi:predicted nucleic acid-binding protein